MNYDCVCLPTVQDAEAAGVTVHFYSLLNQQSQVLFQEISKKSLGSPRYLKTLVHPVRRLVKMELMRAEKESHQLRATVVRDTIVLVVTNPGPPSFGTFSKQLA